MIIYDFVFLHIDLTTAEKTFKEAEKMLEGKQHPILPTIYANLAYIYVENNQIEEAQNFIDEKCLTSFAKIYGQKMLDKCTLPSYAFCHLLKAKIILKSIIKPDSFATAYQLANTAFLIERNVDDEATTLELLKKQIEKPEDQELLNDVKKSLVISRDTFNNAFITLKIDLKNKRASGMVKELGWLHLKSGQLN